MLIEATDAHTLPPLLRKLVGSSSAKNCIVETREQCFALKAYFYKIRDWQDTRQSTEAQAMGPGAIHVRPSHDTVHLGQIFPVTSYPNSRFPRIHIVNSKL